MSNEDVAIPRGLKSQIEGASEIRSLLSRYAKGRKMFKEAIEADDMDLAKSLLKTFDSVLEDTYLSAERLLMLQEYLSTGKAIVIPRDGSKPYRVENEEELKEMVVVSPYELQSVRALSETFGEDAITFVEFDRLK